MGDLNSMFCMNCLRPDSAMLRRDKHDRPTLYCWACRTRTFIHNPAGLRGLRLLAPKIMKIAETLWSQYGHEGMVQEDRKAISEIKNNTGLNDPWKVAANG